MIKALLWIWQLPQNLIGWILSMFSHDYMLCELKNGDLVIIYFLDKFFGSGISLGDYVILDAAYRPGISLSDCVILDAAYRPGKKFWTTIHHEHGHQKQSIMLGPLYLILIGIPSLLGNIYARIFNKSAEWYYNQPWEAWADELGDVER